jgi:hypothetical protein
MAADVGLHYLGDGIGAGDHSSSKIVTTEQLSCMPAAHLLSMLVRSAVQPVLAVMPDTSGWALGSSCQAGTRAMGIREHA